MTVTQQEYTEVVAEAGQEVASTVEEATTTTISITRGVGILHLHTLQTTTIMKRRANLHSRTKIPHMAEILTQNAGIGCQTLSTQKCGKFFLSEFLLKMTI